VARPAALIEPPHAPAAALRRRYLWLWVFGLALGWFEAAVVIDLRALYYPQGFRFPLVLITGRLAWVEIAREAASLALLVAGAWLAAHRFLDRFAAFLILFGVWDLAYYADLKLVLGWPESLSTWDVLFLIPVIWTGPVWAPFLISATLVSIGSYLYLTPSHPRPYRARDWAIEVIAGLLVVLSFTAQWRTVIAGAVPRDFPLWLFGTGWGLGVLWFLLAERRFQSKRPGALAGFHREALP
jgi:hypothetical protein